MDRRTNIANGLELENKSYCYIEMQLEMTELPCYRDRNGSDPSWNVDKHQTGVSEEQLH
jgi:hypothetical protein